MTNDTTNEDPIIELETEKPEENTLLIQKMTEEISDLKDKILRSAAEMENLRRRYEKQIDDVREYSSSSFAKDMISVIDNLSRAISHKPKEMNDEVKNFILGVEMTQTELLSIFAKHGIKTIEPEVGEKFDYNIHHAISQIESDKYPESTIIDVMQVGYKIKDRLLRPASVAVTKALNKKDE